MALFSRFSVVCRVNKLEAKQRRLEREVRQAKREVEGLTDSEAIQNAKRRLRVRQAALRNFVNENDDVLRRNYWRERNDGVPKDWGTMERNEPVVNQKGSDAIEIALDNSSDRGTIKVELNDTDKKAIYDYMSAKSYVVNEKLRNGVHLTVEEQEFVNNLDAALKKIPTYSGNLQRSLIFDSDADVQLFIREYAIGTTIRYHQYISTTRGVFYNPEGQVQLLIKNAKRGRDISVLNQNESEVLYEREAAFKVIGTKKADGKYYILLEESDE